MAHTKSNTDRLLIAPAEAAAMLGVSRQYVYILIGRGDLDAVHLGRARRVTVASVERLAVEGSRNEAQRRLARHG